MRKPVIAANWKMNKTIPEAVDFVSSLRQGLSGITTEGIDIVIAPPFTALKAVTDSLADSGVYTAAQDMYWEEKGAYTGEISAVMLLDAGCRYVIIGHSERRKYFGESDTAVNRKIHRAIYHGLIPIVCVGETLEQREMGDTFKIVRTQVEKALDGLSEEGVSSLIIAYEPVWAIGTGRTATPSQAEEVHGFIRSIIRESYGGLASNSVRIQYGGSVTPENIGKLLKEHDIDGALIGGASLRVDSFMEIISNTIKEASE